MLRREAMDSLGRLRLDELGCILDDDGDDFSEPTAPVVAGAEIDPAVTNAEG